MAARWKWGDAGQLPQSEEADAWEEEGGGGGWYSPASSKVEIAGVGGFASITLRDCSDTGIGCAGGDSGEWTPRGPASSSRASATQWTATADEWPRHRRNLVHRQLSQSSEPPYDRQPSTRGRAQPQQCSGDGRLEAEHHHGLREVDCLLQLPTLDAALAAAPWLRRRIVTADPSWQRTVRAAWPDRPPWLCSLLRQLWEAHVSSCPSGAAGSSCAHACGGEDNGFGGNDPEYRHGGYGGHGDYGYSSYHARHDDGAHEAQYRGPSSPGDSDLDQPRRRRGQRGQRGYSGSRRNGDPLSPAVQPATLPPRQRHDAAKGAKLTAAGPQCCNYRAPVCSDGCALM
eukprot:TRINITY_DN6194_c0_g1_i1.p1 TRINITY_DN6194_c0_g1~~TRINITY_DN6194_c0_g1_i1.p1  ORF type:complete len:343 (+),score=55.01 TRINITY_DN6194_c0_g1_i1:43-1071(+)